MNITAILLLAVGLAMDALAVSIATGLAIKKLRVRHALTVGAFFGGFQALMPVLGWLGGLGFRQYITGIDHWIAFGLLAAIGAKMIYESVKLKKEEEEKEIDELRLNFMLILAVATSLDALAVGLSLSLLKVAIIEPALIIGAVTFIISFAGVYVGDHIGHFFESKIETVAGLVLIGIGVKILVEHLME